MIPDSIQAKIGRNLYLQPNHPLEIIKRQIFEAMQISNSEQFTFLDPIVTIEDNFDRLLIPADHPSRSPSDTYYRDDRHVLRTHTSAHQYRLLSAGYKKFVVTGDVYRRDEIDFCHYPVFHQMEGVMLCLEPEAELKANFIRIIETLFGKIEYRFVNSYFPFTNPSWELEILWNGKWLEIAGMGLIHQDILKSCNISEGPFGQGWAFGIGLERLAMILFDIPDIRLFWSDNPKFLDQFKNGPTKFVPYSKYPVCYKDISFWCKEYNHNDFCEIVRDIGGDLIESVNLIDEYEKEGKGKSYCFRINYQAVDKTLENNEINTLQEAIRKIASEKLNLELR